jgi:hypothetical protein
LRNEGRAAGVEIFLARVVTMATKSGDEAIAIEQTRAALRDGIARARILVHDYRRLARLRTVRLTLLPPVVPPRR